MTNIKELSQLIAERRSIFPAMYSDEKVFDSEIETLLENANWAPNHRKTEPWRFKVFSEEALPRLGSFLAEQYKLLAGDKFKEMKYKKTMKKPTQCSHVIALCVKRDPDGIVPEWEELAALSCAVQNMWLSCIAMGLGCYWSSPKTILKANDFLGLEEDEKCYGLFYIGRPKPEIELSAQRGDVASKTEWIRK